MTDSEAVDAITALYPHATYTQMQAIRKDLQEWSRGLTDGRRKLAVSALATRRGAPAVEAFLDRLAA